ncbi:glycosyltransferase family 39 protein [Rhizobium skierniewicense]|uniref:ArnT family glycosyltransferase n=1 Tax=Rhizobium skierniewicense TaxID=984260 RepID=UPI001FABDDC8|nr:glycosyltransferase family 39 protein [Rhizobium skierniewicense]MCI9866042.1 glycosyltransferase family 39 protein [Rhizobium skierniewicense]
MRKALSRNPDVVLMLIAGYFLFAILSRVIRSPGLEVDEAQQAILSQFLLLGYGSQPPVYSWLQYGVNAILSPSIASLSVLKNGLLFLCCIYFWLTARLLIREKALVNVATLGVLTLPTVFVMSQRDLTHTVLALFAVSLFVYVLFSTLKKPSALGYILTGLVIGLGAVAKYNFVVIPLAAIIAIALEKDLRDRLLDWRLLLTAAAALIIVTPHFLWVLDHLDLATGQTTSEMREGAEHATSHGLSGMLELILAFVKGLALTTAIFAALFFKDIKAILRASDQSTRIIGRIMLFSFLCLLLIVLSMGATHVRQKWVTVYLLLWPLYLCLKVQAAGVLADRRLPSMLAVTSVLTVGFVLVLLGRGVVAPYFDRYSLVHTPYHSFAKLLRNDGHPEPQYIMAVGGIVGGNLKMQFPNSTVFIGDRDVEPLPTSWPAGSVVLLAGDSKEAAMQKDPADVLAALAERTSLPIPTDVTRIDVPYAAASEKRHTFYYAWETIPQR